MCPHRSSSQASDLERPRHLLREASHGQHQRRGLDVVAFMLLIHILERRFPHRAFVGRYFQHEAGKKCLLGCISGSLGRALFGLLLCLD
jgi:hypothetical protein